MQKHKKIFAIFLAALIFINPVLVLAQTPPSGVVSGTDPQYSGVQSSLTTYLCTPSDPPNGKDVEQCVNKLFRGGIAFGAIALVFFLVFAGYMYITGGETGKAKAKGILQNALIGIGLLLGSYVLIGFINPNLLLFKTIQPPIFSAANLPSCQDVGFGAQCTLPDGTAGISNGAGGGTAGGSRPNCIAVPDVPGVCADPVAGDGSFPDSDFADAKPELKTAFNALKQKVSGLSEKQVYRSAQYSAFLRSVFESYMLTHFNWTDADLKSYGQYCQSSGVQYVTTADAKNPKVKAWSEKYQSHFGTLTATQTSPTTCVSDHSQGVAMDMIGYSTTAAFEATAKSVGLCHDVPQFTAHGATSNKDERHFALSNAPGVTCVNYWH